MRSSRQPGMKGRQEGFQEEAQLQSILMHSWDPWLSHRQDQ